MIDQEKILAFFTIGIFAVMIFVIIVEPYMKNKMEKYEKELKKAKHYVE